MKILNILIIISITYSGSPSSVSAAPCDDLLKATCVYGQEVGDLDGNGYLTDNDIAMLELLVNASKPFKEKLIGCADVNGNNIVESEDIVKLKELKATPPCTDCANLFPFGVYPADMQINKPYLPPSNIVNCVSGQRRIDYNNDGNIDFKDDRLFRKVIRNTYTQSSNPCCFYNQYGEISTNNARCYQTHKINTSVNPPVVVPDTTPLWARCGGGVPILNPPTCQ